MKRLFLVSWIICSVILIMPKKGNTLPIDFEGLSDREVVTNQYSGLSFTNAITLTAGISLNELDFPPMSGSNVVSDDFGPMMVSFNTPVESLWGYFTYVTPLTLKFYDSSNALVGTVSSNYLENYTSSGNSPNELLGLNYLAGISRAEITGDPSGASFTLDNLDYKQTPPVPEPATLLILGTAIVTAFSFKKRNS